VLQPINTALNEYCGIESTAYALAVIRPDGSIATFMSDEVKTDPKYLFTPAFKNEFLVASGHAPLCTSHPPNFTINTNLAPQIQISEIPFLSVNVMHRWHA
jgi:hypothetical protein